jgi:hypothetical protein
MIRTMRVANMVLLLFVAVAWCAQLLQGVRGLPELLGFVVGAIAFGAPFYLSWRGLGPQSSLKAVQRARSANVVLIGGLVLLAVGLGVLVVLKGNYSRGLRVSLPIGLTLLVYLVPAILNIKALRKRKAELEQPSSAAVGVAAGGPNN